MTLKHIPRFIKGLLKSSGHKIALSYKPKRSPWGGGNQVVEQLVAHLQDQRHRVTFRLEPGVTAILLVDPRPSDTTTFGVPEIRAFKAAHPEVFCVHRINECDLRKNTDEMDEILRQANVVADYTVFISHWLRDYFVARWFDPRWPHGVIQNGADPEMFYPDPAHGYRPGSRFKIVTHHWSDNWNKGFRVYQEVDRLIASGELGDCALMVIGRWPQEIKWQAAATHPPTRGRALAHLLRQNHVYLTASLWEPCGMHHVEGAQCGLPLVYHEDGGGIVEFGRRYGVSFRDDVAGALRQAQQQYATLHRQVLSQAPSGANMSAAYEAVLTGRVHSASRRDPDLAAGEAGGV
jgi:glycosyltransferase involved in cell wall biosynthesis